MTDFREAVVCKGNPKLSGEHSRQYATASSFITLEPKKVTMAMEPLTIFQRICILPESDASLENYFQFELLPYPLSLFDKAGMQKTKKSKLYSVLQDCDVYISSKDKFVIDGSFLLHRMLWTRGKTFNETTTTYVSHIERHFGSNCRNIFGGYKEKRLKSMEHRRQYTKCVPDIIIHRDNTITVSRELFLSNSKNKRQFIQLLCVNYEDDVWDY